MRAADSARKLAVTAVGIGRVPAGGTVASAAAALLCGAAWWLLGGPAALAIAAGLMVVCAILGVRLGSWAEHHYGRDDPPQFVLDEVVGQLLVCLLFPYAWPGGLFAAFVAFRAFDISKPFPIRRVEKLDGGWGVMLDDVVAAAYAAVVLWGLALTLFSPLRRSQFTFYL